MLTVDAEPPPAPLWRRTGGRGLLLNAPLVLLLFLSAFLIRWNATQGDLWLDEADYAAAARRGVQLNRWDRTDNPQDPDRLVRYRHYHPPGVVTLILTTSWARPTDREMRLPFVLIGSLSVALVYLCGLLLYDKRITTGSRYPALACAVILMFSPADIRAGSHALPWAAIVFLLLLLFWTLLLTLRTGNPRWLIASGGALGAMFVTSEFFFPALLAAGCAAPFALRGQWREALSRRRLLIAAAAGALVALSVALAFWPHGVSGGALRMMRHYVAMSGDAWPVMLHGKRYDRAPKWAYLYWYARFYPAFALCYALGVAYTVWQAAQRRLTPELATLLAFTGIVLLVVHRAHIIGPAYFVPVLPFLTLLGGFFFQSFYRRSRPRALGTMAALCLACALIPTRWDVLNMDRRSQISRWPQAAQFLAARWRPGDSMLAPAFGSAARWYLLNESTRMNESRRISQPPRLDERPLPIREWQVQALPDQNATRAQLQEVAEGDYRFVAVGSLYDDRPAVDSRLFQIVRRWPCVWTSDEESTGPSRLALYERPPGVSRCHPLPIPAPDAGS